MGAEAAAMSSRASAGIERLASRWLHTCLGPVSWPPLTSDPPPSSNQGSASPMRQTEHAYQVAADVATRDSRGHVERNVEHAAAVHMVALGCAHDQGIGRSCACGGGIHRLAIVSL